jgi:hypothetical protein
MQHNVDMLAKHTEDWKGKVKIIGLSIDKDIPTIEKHVEAKKWGTVEHWFRNISECSTVYSVNGVPHVMLIDKSGKIVFKGHPANRPNLEQDLTDLADGKELTGEGIATNAAPAESSPAAVPEGFAELDKSVIDAEIAKIGPILEGFTKNEELATQAKGCPRAFCVIALQENYFPNTGKTLFKYENYRVVVGPKDNIDGLKATFEKKLTGNSFTPIIRE